VHLQADLMATIQWANDRNIRWAFSDRNAGARFANFYADPYDLDKINWTAVHETDFRDMLVKEAKQAEFLIYESFPWELVEKIGVCNGSTRDHVTEKLGNSISPQVTIEKTWYY